MKLTVFELDTGSTWIRPAQVERDWMDATPDRFAYRCLPLNLANQHGWEILSPVDVAARWDGGGGVDAIEIRTTGDVRLGPTSHFGSGVLTFHVSALLRTDPGYNLWVTGPVNGGKDALVPLSGLIETDWSPYSFTMNWRFTRPHQMVMFATGEPFCHFFPIPRALAESVELVAGDLGDEPELQARYAAWSADRSSFNADLREEGSAARAAKWQRKYFQGLNPDGVLGSAGHQTNLSLCPYTGRRR